MSKLSRFLIGVIIVGLAFIASLHLYRAYEKYAEDSEEAAGPTMTFNNVPIQRVPPVIEEPVFRRWPAESGTESETAQPQEIYLQDATLDAQTEQKQALQTMQSILADYKQDPQLQAFYQDLQQITGRPIDLFTLRGEELGALMTAYPEVPQLISKYSKDPEFAKTLQAIFSNPQFIRSIEILQRNGVEQRKSTSSR